MSETISQQKNLMKCVLEDSQLNRLRLEGGTFLARVRKEEASESESYRYNTHTHTASLIYTLYLTHTHIHTPVHTVHLTHSHAFI